MVLSIAICIFILHSYGSPQKHRACNRPGCPFCDKACNRIRGSCDKPSCHKAVEDYSNLHRGLQQGFVTEGLRQRLVTAGGGPRQTLISRHCPNYVHMYTDLNLSVDLSIYLSIHLSICLFTYLFLCLYIYLYMYIFLPIDLSIYLSIYLSISLSLSLSMFLSICC